MQGLITIQKLKQKIESELGIETTYYEVSQ